MATWESPTERIRPWLTCKCWLMNGLWRTLQNLAYVQVGEVACCSHIFNDCRKRTHAKQIRSQVLSTGESGQFYTTGGRVLWTRPCSKWEMTSILLVAKWSFETFQTARRAFPRRKLAWATHVEKVWSRRVPTRSQDWVFSLFFSLDVI